MTLLVAFARRDLALLAADTRTTFRAGPEGPAEGFDDDDAKVFGHGGGWLASGPSVRWRDAVLAGTPPDAAMAELEAVSPALACAVRARQLTFVVGAGYRRVLDWRGTERFPGAAPAILGPNGSDEALVTTWLNGYARALRGAGPCDVLRLTGAFFERVYDHCGPDGTVSPLVAVGLVWPDGGRALVGPLHHAALRGAGDDAIGELLAAEVRC